MKVGHEAQAANPKRLRELAAWYRDFAEATGNPTIWECRLRTADDLEKDATRLETPTIGR
jgi:hypothetical protein